MTGRDFCAHCYDTLYNSEPFCDSCGKCFCLEHMKTYDEVGKIYSIYVGITTYGHEMSSKTIDDIIYNIIVLIKKYDKKLYKGDKYNDQHNSDEEYFSNTDTVKHIHDVISSMDNEELCDYLAYYFNETYPFICYDCHIDEYCKNNCNHCESYLKYKI